MMDRIDEWRSELFLLIDMDWNISEITQNYAKIIYSWPKRLENILDEAYKKQYDDRVSLEQNMLSSRDQFEKEMAHLVKEAKIIDTYVDLFSYPTYAIPIKEFHIEFEGMKKRRDRLEHEENVILGIKSSYESFYSFEKEFEPHYLFWEMAEEFLDSKKFWKGATASTLNVESIKKIKSKAQRTLKKVRNKLAPQQRKWIEGILQQIKDVESWMAIIETLSNPGLKKRHWDQIKEISGADIDFQKMSIDRIKFLKIEYMLEPVTKVSEVASKEYSIELYLKSMNEEFLKYQEQFEQIEEKSHENDKKLKSILVSSFFNL